MKQKFLLSLLLFCILGKINSQTPELSPKSYISVITCGAGEELYSSFGHSAFRVQDSVLGIDVVYNYGTFNFNTPNFYTKFARGKLLYSLSRNRFENFLFSYELEQRWVKEQILSLSLKEKNELFRFLENNYLPENRDYKYDFFYDNCATRERDVLEKVYGSNIVFKENHLEEQYTFRELIHQNLSTNSWAAFGIDLALGSVIDKKASPREHMYLPFYVMKQLDNTDFNGKPIVQRERTILDFGQKINGNYLLASPLFWLLLLLLFVVIITYIDFKNITRSRWLDFFLFIFTGIAGFIILFLWLLTDHSATAGNFNILWAFAPNLVIAFFIIKKNRLPDWFDIYLYILLGLLVLCIVLWLVGVQTFSPLISILLLTLGIRYLFLHYTFKKGELV
ncbi:hypothetical protein GGR42_002859 [Saonia flava]|uniref:DUF4105 domain-containing protein n=1 Tax=Saonia flava TaxID=523696 RepID=A0A846QWL9_9FLAO|nr:DUF4105 domain-containing protein [Saonia flava]NJB72368.1 hypothetical protein [Saonia flava]